MSLKVGSPGAKDEPFHGGRASPFRANLGVRVTSCSSGARAPGPSTVSPMDRGRPGAGRASTSGWPTWWATSGVFVKAPRPPSWSATSSFPCRPPDRHRGSPGRCPTPEVVAGCRHLVQNGYALALDHYVWDDDDDRVAGHGLDHQARRPQPSRSPNFRTPSAITRSSASSCWPKRIETREQLEVCQTSASNLFEGYLLGRPDVVEGDALYPDRVVCLRILEELGRPGTSGRESRTSSRPIPPSATAS